MANSQIIYNRYQGRWAPSGQMTVDAPDMATAVRLMSIKKGEPIHVATLETNVYIAASVPSATFVTEARCGDISGDSIGNVYPASSTVPIGNTVYLNAVPTDQYEFVNYTNESGKVLATTSEYKFVIMEDIRVIANFKEREFDPKDLSIDPIISKLLRVNHDDGNYEKSQYNQDHISVTTALEDGMVMATVTGDINNLKSFTSTSGMGVAKWIGILVNTQEDYTKTSIYYNGAMLPDSEFTDANYLGVPGNGTFILWLKAEEIAVSPKLINVYTTDKQKKVYINISFKNTDQ